MHSALKTTYINKYIYISASANTQCMRATPLLHTGHACHLYIDASVNTQGMRAISHSKHRSVVFQNGVKSGTEMCFGPGTLGAGAKTRLEFRIKKFTPHCICIGAPKAPGCAVHACKYNVAGWAVHERGHHTLALGTPASRAQRTFWQTSWWCWDPQSMKGRH